MCQLLITNYKLGLLYYASSSSSRKEFWSLPLATGTIFYTDFNETVTLIGHYSWLDTMLLHWNTPGGLLSILEKEKKIFFGTH
jgi:hypothetical protein